MVVDVKPRERLTSPKAAFTLDWTGRAAQSRGWRYEVWSEPPAARLENLRFLSGYRRDWLFDSTLLAELRQADFDGLTLGDAAQIPLGHGNRRPKGLRGAGTAGMRSSMSSITA